LLAWASTTDEMWLVFDQVGYTEWDSLVQHSSLAGYLSWLGLGMPWYMRLSVVR